MDHETGLFQSNDTANNAQPHISYATAASSSHQNQKNSNHIDANEHLEKLTDTNEDAFKWTLEPWVPPSAKKLQSISRAQRLAVLSYLNPLSNISAQKPSAIYYEVKFPPNVNIKQDINIIKTQKEIIGKTGPLPKRPLNMVNPAEYSKNSYLIKTNDTNQSTQLKSIKTLDNHPVIVEPCTAFNLSQGIVISDALKKSTIEEIKADLEGQGVFKVESLPQFSPQGVSKPSNKFILHFNSSEIPQVILLGGVHRILVEPYVSLPKRCRKCQLLGHSTGQCKDVQRCTRCGEATHKSEDCAQPAQCVNCCGDHPANSNNCPHYMMKKEILKIRSEYKLTSTEAYNIIYSKYFSTGKECQFKTIKTNNNNENVLNSKDREPARQQTPNENSISRILKNLEEQFTAEINTNEPKPSLHDRGERMMHDDGSDGGRGLAGGACSDGGRGLAGGVCMNLQNDPLTQTETSPDLQKMKGGLGDIKYNYKFTRFDKPDSRNSEVPCASTPTNKSPSKLNIENKSPNSGNDNHQERRSRRTESSTRKRDLEEPVPNPDIEKRRKQRSSSTSKLNQIPTLIGKNKY